MRSAPVLALMVLLGCGGSELAPHCSVDGECPVHQFCDGRTLACISGCLSDGDCQGQSCNAHGRCVDATDAGAGVDLQSRDLDLGTGEDLRTPPDLLLVGDLGPCAGVCSDHANEPNDKPADATVLASSTMTLDDLAICPSGDVDWYKVTAAKAGTLVVDLTAGPCGTAVRIDMLGQDAASPVGTSTATATGWHAEDPVTAGKVRYLKVSAATAPGRNTYQLSVDVN
jgi:hypothetical protein